MFEYCLSVVITSYSIHYTKLYEGINTAIVAAGQGIGFAIPINLARLIANQLMENGEVSRGWLGVSIQAMTPELAESFGLDKVNGALVNRVFPGSPAAQAGVKRGDILLSFAGKEIRITSYNVCYTKLLRARPC